MRKRKKRRDEKELITGRTSMPMKDMSFPGPNYDRLLAKSQIEEENFEI